MRNVAALPPRRTFGLVMGGIGLPRQLSFGHRLFACEHLTS